MQDKIEERLAGTPRFCELDKAWHGIQCCLCGGIQDVAEIAAYLRQNDLQQITRSSFRNITEEGYMYKQVIFAADFYTAYPRKISKTPGV